jgi:hypothetical protein
MILLPDFAASSRGKDGGFNISISIKGWVELEGRRLKESELEAILRLDPSAISRLGGEFFLRYSISGLCRETVRLDL